MWWRMPYIHPVGGSGRGASPANFIGFTVGDKIKQKWPNSKVFGVSMKDRSAILMTGHRADGAYWFETSCGCFITSTYYAKEAPGWLTEFNNRKLPASYATKTWDRLLPDTAIYEKYAGKDDQAGEWDLKDTTFPHVFRTKPPETAYYTSLTRTPFSDQMVLQLALRVLETNSLGKDESPDVLAVGFSATDVIGHTYGAYSQEVMDEYLRLDRVLGQLFQAVEQQAGAGNFQVILSADHGSTPLVEWLQEHGSPEATAAASHGADRRRQPRSGRAVPKGAETRGQFLQPGLLLRSRGDCARQVSRAKKWSAYRSAP